MVWGILLAIVGMAFWGALWMAQRKGAAEENAKDAATTANNLRKAKDAVDKIDRLDAAAQRERLRSRFGK